MKILNHNLSHSLLLSILVISIFTLFFAASLSYKQIESLGASEKRVRHSYMAYVELEQLNSYTKDAETNQRGFLLTHDSSFLVKYYAACKKINNKFLSIKLLTSDNIQQSKNLDSLLILINQRLIYLKDVLTHKSGNADAYRYNMIIKGREIMALTQVQMDKMIAFELHLLKQRQSIHEKYSKLSPFSMLFIVLFSLAVFILAYVKINKDLKRLTKTNNQLMINNSLFAHAEHIAQLSNWRWDVESNTYVFSQNLYYMLGCEPNEFDSTFENFVAFVHPDDRHIISEIRHRALKELSTDTIFRIIRKDGIQRTIKSMGKVITDNYGKTFLIGVNADITEQYKKDKFLEEKLADLTNKNKQLSQFNHIASHDLQEPLRKVQLYLSRIREDFETLPEKAKDYFSGIEKAAVRMQRLMDDLLLYLRANKTDKIFEETDLNALMENSKQALSQIIEEKNAIIRISSPLPVLKVIPFQIQELFINIISNSIKYSKTDIAPLIEIETTKVTGNHIPGRDVETDGYFYKISISDNGIGFEPDQAQHIFTLFYRLHNEKDYSGTGIGLAVCKIIVENHNGYIEAIGIPDTGSTFNIYLPLTSLNEMT